MTLVSKHATGEQSSPFYIENKEKCEAFESFIEELGGSVEGYYNAFSFNVLGTVEKKSKWKLRFKKSTFTSSGNLLLSSKFQSLLDMAQWSSDDLKIDAPEFIIRKKHWTDSLKMLINSDLTELPSFENYVVKCSEKNNQALLKLCDILSDLFEKGMVLTIKYENPKLLVDLRTGQIHKKEIVEIIKL